MRGRVCAINPRRGTAAVDVGGDYTILELTGGNVDVGEEVARGEGSQFKNLTTGRDFRAYILNEGVPRGQLREQLLVDD